MLYAMRSIASPLGNLAALAAALLSAFLLVEGAVRALDPQPEFRYRFSPDTFYEPIPGADFVYRREEFAVRVAYNQHGMRDRARSIERSERALRIACVGDSYLEAKEVPLDSCTTQLLENTLAHAHTERDVEVLNFGVSGFGTVASAIRLERLALPFRPDLVLYFFIENDPVDNVANDARLYTIEEGELRARPIVLGPAARAARAAVDAAKQRLHAYRWLRGRLEQLRARWAPGTRDAARASPAGAEPSEAAWSVTRQAIAKMQRDAVRAGARLLVVQASTSGTAMSARLDRICAELAVPLIDVTAPLAEASGPVRYRYDGHWRSQGHAAVAAALARAVGAYVPTTPPSVR
jgi:hypothetical protein